MPGLRRAGGVLPFPGVPAIGQGAPAQAEALALFKIKSAVFYNYAVASVEGREAGCKEENPVIVASPISREEGTTLTLAGNATRADCGVIFKQRLCLVGGLGGLGEALLVQNYGHRLYLPAPEGGALAHGSAIPSTCQITALSDF